MKKIALGLVLVLMICITSGCSSISSTISDIADSGSLEKYNAYIEFNNFITGWLDLNINGYFENLGYEDEVTIPENVTGAYVTPVIDMHFEKIRGVIEYTDKKPEYNKVDESIKSLAPKIIEIMNTMNEIDKYYRTDKGYEKDNFAKGQELHKKFLAQCVEYYKEREKFFEVFGELTTEQGLKDAETLSSSGKYIKYNTLKILIKSQKLEEYLIDNEIDDSNILDLDIVYYKPKYEEIKEDIQLFKIYIDKEDYIEKEELSAFSERLKENILSIEKSLDELLNILETQNTDVKAEGKVVTGDLAVIHYLHRNIDNTVDIYNTMN